MDYGVTRSVDFQRQVPRTVRFTENYVVSFSDALDLILSGIEEFSLCVVIMGVKRKRTLRSGDARAEDCVVQK